MAHQRGYPATRHHIEHHGYLHEPPSTFTSAAQEEEALAQGIETLTRITGRRPRAYRRHSGNSARIHTLLEKHGFEYTGDLMDTLPADYHVVDAARPR